MKKDNSSSMKERAETVLKKVQQALIKKYCMLTPLITSMNLRPVAVECVLETDGKNIFYQPACICRMAKEKKLKQLQRQYMHLLVHGLLFHYVDYRKYSMMTLANAIFDLEVELFLQRLSGENNNRIYPSFDLRRNTKEASLYETLEKIGSAGLYQKALESKPLRRTIYAEAKKAVMDQHRNWQGGSGGKRLGGSEDTCETSLEEKEKIRMFWTRMLQSCMSKTGLSLNELVAQMKGEKGKYGDMSIGMDTVVGKDSSKPLDYETVLRQFFREKEICRMDPDSFDRDIYALGMDLYEDVVLLEPREDGSRKAIGTIVLAIDTSGSCAGEIIQKFMAQTEGLLRTVCQMEYQQLVILQADAAICHEIHLKPGDPLPDCNRMQVYGFGGTDFCPVFRRVEELSEENEVDVLIYLTDAYGSYPNKEPEVKTFFVIPDLEKQQQEIAGIVPAWIECLAI